MKIKQITDMDLLVYLIAKNFKIIKKEKSGKKTIFYFEETRELDSSILSFVNRSETINIADILGAQRRLKTLLCLENK
ncbi:DUF5659 domain-containing protein [Clostridium sulfidigenes]|uniref:DUF5659 domain-containing protein n=1 Tax=Clostridium sulfidigenes TaxID=318464 RepID=UPI003F8B437E